MRCSQNEVLHAVRKAALGSGFEVGIAEDLGRAAGWLCSREFDGLDAALVAISPGPDVPCPGPDEHGTFVDARIASVGPAALDLLAAGVYAEIRLTNVDSELLLRGLAAGAAEAAGVVIDVETDGAGDVQLRLGPNAGADRAETDVDQIDGAEIDVDPSAWQQIGELAARTYVPSSAASRERGAGAGLTDND